MIKLFWRQCRPGNLCSHGQVEPLFAEPVNRNLTLGHLWHWKIPQGTCHSDYDCVSPGFHICIENCTDRSLQNGRMNENGRPPSEGLLTPSERLKAFVILSPLFILYKYFSSNLSLINLFSKPTFDQYILWDLPFLKYQTAWNLSLTHISWTTFPQISLTNIYPETSLFSRWFPVSAFPNNTESLVTKLWHKNHHIRNDGAWCYFVNYLGARDFKIWRFQNAQGLFGNSSCCRRLCVPGEECGEAVQGCAADQDCLPGALAFQIRS